MFNNRDPYVADFENLADPVAEAFIAGVKKNAPRTAQTPGKRLRAFCIHYDYGRFVFFSASQDFLDSFAHAKEHGISDYFELLSEPQEHELGEFVGHQKRINESEDDSILWSYLTFKIMEYVFVRAKEEGAFKDLPLTDNWFVTYGSHDACERQRYIPGSEVVALKDWAYPPYLNDEDLRTAVQMKTPPREMTIFGPFIAKEDLNIVAWPDVLDVQSIFEVSENATTSLPRVLTADMVRIRNCPNLRSWPDKLFAESLHIEECPGFTAFPADLKTDSIRIRACPGLKSLPAQASAKDVELQETNLTTIDPAFRTRDLRLWLDGPVTALPKNLKLNSLLLSEWMGALPDVILVGGYKRISLFRCNDVTELPQSLQLEDARVSLRCCANLSKLPDPLYVYDLEIDECPQLGALPTTIKVRGNLIVKNCPNLKKPDSLNVEGKIIWNEECRIKGAYLF